MKLQKPAARLGDLGNTVALAHPQSTSPLAVTANFFKKMLIIAEWEVRKLRHDPTDVFTRTVQPALWLLIFGEVFSRIRAIPTGKTPYLDFLAPGILSQSVLFIAIFYGIAIIWERDLGVINKFLVSPTPRLALVLGKSLSAGARPPTGAHHLYPVGHSGRQAELQSSCAVGCHHHCATGSSPLLHHFDDYRLHIENTRPRHGHWSDFDDAIVLRQQCHLPYRHHARLAASDRPYQPANIRRRWSTFDDAGREYRYVGTGN